MGNKNLWKKFLNFFLFANVGKEKFKTVYPHVKSTLHNDNRNNLNTFSVIAALLLLAMIIASLLATELGKYTILYTIMFVISIAVWLLNRLAMNKSFNFVRALIYIFLLSAFIFSIILGTAYSPEELTATFFVLIIAGQLLFIDRPFNYIFLILCSYAVFIAMAVVFKDRNVLVTDLTNATVFTLFAMASCVYTMNIKLQKYILEYENEIASETDILTGIKNRRCFEAAIRNYPSPLLKNTYFIYVDANGLHEINDMNGHIAGDDMLKCVAEEMKKQFGENVFRIGGDEYVTFGTSLSQGEIEAKLDTLIENITLLGYSASAGYALGTDAETITDLIKSAELKMYAAKANYYKESGRDRRRKSY